MAAPEMGPVGMATGEMTTVGMDTGGMTTGGMLTEGMFTGGILTASAGMLAFSSLMNLAIKLKTFSISSILGLFAVTAGSLAT